MTVRVRKTQTARANGKMRHLEYAVMECDGPNCSEDATHPELHPDKWLMVTRYREAVEDTEPDMISGQHLMSEEHYCSDKCLLRALTGK